MQVKSVYEKRVAIARAVMIAARAAHLGWVKRCGEIDRALDILIRFCGAVPMTAARFLTQICRGSLSVRRVLEMNLSEVPHV